MVIKIIIVLKCLRARVELAQLGLKMLKSSVYQLVRENGEKGIQNSDAARLLGLRSDYQGNQKDYLSYSILGLLIREGKVERVNESGKITHRRAPDKPDPPLTSSP